MLNILKRNNQREQEEKKLKDLQEEEEIKNGIIPANNGTIQKTKKSPGELRLKKEIAELDLPTHAEINFPDEQNIMKFELFVDLTKEECLWKGAKYKFTIAVPPNYPHEAPKCHCETQIYHPNIDL